MGSALKGGRQHPAHPCPCHPGPRRLRVLPSGLGLAWAEGAEKRRRNVHERAKLQTETVFLSLLYSDVPKDFNRVPARGLGSPRPPVGMNQEHVHV